MNRHESELIENHEIVMKLAEAQNWLVCNCEVCRSIRNSAGKESLEGYMDLLRKLLQCTEIQ